VNLKASDAKMDATLNLHGLDKLLSGYGVDVDKDVIVDFWRHARFIVPTMGRIGTEEIPQILNVQDGPLPSGADPFIDTSFAALFRMEDMAVPFASSLSLKTDKQPNAKLKVVMRSSPASVHLTGDTVDLELDQKWSTKIKGQQQRQYAIAADVEGTLKTAFPEGDKQGVEAPAQSAQPARVFVLASSEFFANPLARAGNGPDMGQYGQMMPSLGGDEKLLMLAGPYAQQFITPAILVFKNLLDWLSGDTDVLAVSAKIQSDPNLVYNSKVKISVDETEEQLHKQEEEMRAARKDEQRNVELVLVFGVPLFFAAYGLLRWRMRNAAREAISLA